MCSTNMAAGGNQSVFIVIFNNNHRWSTAARNANVIYIDHKYTYRLCMKHLLCTEVTDVVMVGNCKVMFVNPWRNTSLIIISAGFSVQMKILKICYSWNCLFNLMLIGVISSSISFPAEQVIIIDNLVQSFQFRVVDIFG